MHQAAELYLLQIVEENTYVGIVTFSDKGEIKSHVHQIVSDEARKQLASYLPTAPGGKRANVCAGLKLACEVKHHIHCFCLHLLYRWFVSSVVRIFVSRLHQMPYTDYCMVSEKNSPSFPVNLLFITL